MGIGSDQWKLITSYQIFIIENHFSITNWLQLRKISFSWSFSRWRAEETFENNQSKIVVFCSTIWLSFSLWKSAEARFNYSETDFLIQSNFNTLPISIPLTEKSLKRVLPGCMSERKSLVLFKRSREKSVLNRKKKWAAWALLNQCTTSKIAKKIRERKKHLIQKMFTHCPSVAPKKSITVEFPFISLSSNAEKSWLHVDLTTLRVRY